MGIVLQFRANVKLHSRLLHGEMMDLKAKVEQLKRERRTLGQSVKRASSPRPEKVVERVNAAELDALTASFFEEVKQ